MYRRRGLRYAGYLVAQSWRLRWLYRYAWGPRAPRVVAMLFRACAPLMSRRASDAALRTAGLDSGRLPQADAALASALLDRAHAAGITGLEAVLDGPFGSAGAARIAGARLHRRRGACYLAARDADRRRLNERFGTSLLTEASARAQLGLLRDRVRNGYRDYAPIDFGGGLSFGDIASTDSGTGRWDFLNGAIVGPLVAGKRVLDLGCNNGSLTLMMLRAGAREVVAIELTPEIAAVARFNARILAWRDIRQYRCRVLTGDMRRWLTEDLGRFDVVTAFCSLYYLPETDMARIVRKAADMRATLVLQANDVITNLPAQTDTLCRLMQDNGYEQVRISAYPGFPRQLLVSQPTSPYASAIQADRRAAAPWRADGAPASSVSD